MIGNEVADLTQQREPTLRWLLFSAFCFHNRALWHGASQKPMLFSPETPSAYGMAVSFLKSLPRKLERPMLFLSFVWFLVIITELVNGTGPLLLSLGTVLWALFVLYFGLRLAIVPDRVIFLRSEERRVGKECR